MHVPPFDGRAPSFANYERKVALRNQISPLDPQARAANLYLHRTDVARNVCMSVGKDVIGSAYGVAQILRILRE